MRPNYSMLNAHDAQYFFENPERLIEAVSKAAPSEEHIDKENLGIGAGFDRKITNALHDISEYATTQSLQDYIDFEILIHEAYFVRINNANSALPKAETNRKDFVAELLPVVTSLFNLIKDIKNEDDVNTAESLEKSTVLRPLRKLFLSSANVEMRIIQALRNGIVFLNPEIEEVLSEKKKNDVKNIIDNDLLEKLDRDKTERLIKNDPGLSDEEMEKIFNITMNLSFEKGMELDVSNKNFFDVVNSANIFSKGVSFRNIPFTKLPNYIGRSRYDERKDNFGYDSPAIDPQGPNLN